MFKEKMSINYALWMVLLLLMGLNMVIPMSNAAATEPYGLSAMQQFERLPYLKLDTLAGGQSSFDRSGGNGDTGVFLYTEGSDKVMLDLKGPGVVYRIWTTGMGSSDYIKAYFNGETTPRINMLWSALYAGTNAPFLAPLVGNNAVSSGGFYCYLPLPFSQSIKIVTNGSFYYNIGYHLFSPDTVVSTWTGSEDSSVVRNIWNNAGADPKSDSGNTTVTNTINLAAGGTQTLLDTTGPRSISSIKLRIPGVEGSAGNVVTHDGRAHKGYSQFVSAINSSNQGVTLKRRFDYGIADQKANVYVDGALVGEWYTAGSDTSYNWRDSSFVIPSTYTAGKSSITVKVVFVSAAIDWNEFYYWVYSKVDGNDTLTDSLDVANTTSESNHGYVINTQNWTGSRTYQYPPSGSDGLDILNNVWLKINWDNETNPSVNATLGSFFAAGQFGLKIAVRALPVGIDANNYLYAYFPMPFASNARIQLVSQRTTSTDNITYEVKHKAFTDSFTNVGYFKTFFNNQNVVGGDANDMLILDTTGSGNFLGAVESMKGNTTSRWYLEGDERIYVDDGQATIIHGTGTEDFYNGGWYFDHGLFTTQMHGNSSHVVDTVDKTAAYRFFLQDLIPFRKQIRVSIEHGTGNDSTEEIWTLAYYYHKTNLRAVLADTVDVGNSSSESSHAYTINNATWNGTNVFTYEGDFDNVNISDDGRSFTGYSQFTVAIPSSNAGVILRRRFDQNNLNQLASVFVDGALVGTWYKAGNNTTHRWRDEDFLIPASFTTGKNQIQIKVQFVSGTVWSEYKYQVFVCSTDAGSTPTPTPAPTATVTPGGPSPSPNIPNSKSDTNNLAQTGTGRMPVYVVDHFGNAFTIMTDGVKTGGTSDDSWNAQLKSEDYWGISFDQTYGFNKVVYTTGNMFVDGGWFSSGLKVQVRQYGVWVDVTGLNTTPAYPYNNTAGPNKSYTMTFNDTWGDAIRVDGVPVQVTGYNFSFTSIGEFEIYYALTGPTPTPTPTPGPAVLFSDGFESNNFTAGGWTNSGCDLQTTYKYAGTYAARFNSSDSLTKARSTAGYQNIQVKYARYTRSCETDDHFIAEWYNGSAWATLEDLTGNSGWTARTWNLPTGANNNANFQIRFRTSHNGSSDYAYLDEVQILGTNL